MFPSPTPPAAPDPAKEAAQEIARTVWDGKTPKPAGRGAFLGLRAVAHALLVAGHDRDTIVDGMLRASPVTIRTVEFAIGHPPGGGGPRERISRWDRSEPDSALDFSLG